MRFTRLLAICILSTLGSAAHAEDDTHAKVAGLVTRGEDLMHRAFVMAGSKPETKLQVEMLFNRLGAQWGTDEYNFRQDLNPLLSQSLNLPDDMNDALFRLGQFINFAFDGATSLNECKNVHAYWDMRIAAQILRHARLASDGQPDPDWAPELLDSPPEAIEQCR